jgi:hypothetical protein
VGNDEALVPVAAAKIVAPTPSKGGRPRGAVNLRTRQIADFCRHIVEDEEYRAGVLQRAREGRLGSMEPVIWAYGYGKPKETLDINVARVEDLSHLTTAELEQRAREILDQLSEVRAIEDGEVVDTHVVNANA